MWLVTCGALSAPAHRGYLRKMNKTLDAETLKQADTGARVNGILDRPGTTRISGWAIDRADPNAHVEVDIYYDGVLLGHVSASDYRKDLQRNGIGTGKYGFKYELREAIDPDMSFAITAIARTKDGMRAPLRNTGRTAKSDDPAIRLGQRAYLRSCGLRQEIADLSCKLDDLLEQIGTASVDPDVLERIELVQARLETILPREGTPRPVAQTAGLKVAVSIALLFGVASLSLGLISLWMG